MMSESLRQRWTRVAHVVMEQLPGWVPQAPATDEEIEAAEEALGRRFPSLLVEMLRLSSAWSWPEPRFDAVNFLAPDEIVRESTPPGDEGAEISVSVSLSDQVKPIYYSPRRLTIAYSDYCRFQIDDDPEPSGVAGQIVAIDHDEETIEVIAGSLEAFIVQGLEALERELALSEQPAGAAPESVPYRLTEESPELFMAQWLDAMGKQMPPLERSVSAAPVSTPECESVPDHVGEDGTRRSSECPSVAHDLSQVVTRYKAWLTQNAPVAAKNLRKGLSEDAIRNYLANEASVETPLRLPEALFALFQQFDGQKTSRTALLPCPLKSHRGLTLASLEEMGSWRDNGLGAEILYQGSDRRRYKSDPGVRPVFWHEDWLPFADMRDEQAGVYRKLFVDLAPQGTGREGQIVLQTLLVREDHQDDERLVIAGSLASYFGEIVEAMEAGDIVYDVKCGIRWA